MFLLRRGLCAWSHVPSEKGVSVPVPMFLGAVSVQVEGLCLGSGEAKGSLSGGVSIWRVSVQGVSVRETPYTETLLYGEEWRYASYWIAFLFAGYKQMYMVGDFADVTGFLGQSITWYHPFVRSRLSSFCESQDLPQLLSFKMFCAKFRILDSICPHKHYHCQLFLCIA